MKLFFKRWKQGIKDLTPKQIIEAKLFGMVGQIVGLLLAMVFVGMSDHKYFLLFLAFTAFILIAELLRTYKEYKVMIEW